MRGRLVILTSRSWIFPRSLEPTSRFFSIIRSRISSKTWGKSPCPPCQPSWPPSWFRGKAQGQREEGEGSPSGPSGCPGCPQGSGADRRSAFSGQKPAQETAEDGLLVCQGGRRACPWRFRVFLESGGLGRPLLISWQKPHAPATTYSGKGGDRKPASICSPVTPCRGFLDHKSHGNALHALYLFKIQDLTPLSTPVSQCSIRLHQPVP